MTTHFQVQVLEFSTLQEVKGAWTSAHDTALLDAMEYGDCAELSTQELHEVCLMSLQDQAPEDAAYLVLKHVIGSDLSEGQLRNMANEMRDEKLWEEYVNPAFHARLFTAGSVLYQAMPSVFPKTDAVQIKLEITASDIIAENILLPSPDMSFLARLLADGMDDHAVMRRLYDDQLNGHSFPNAVDIIWSAKAERVSELAYLVDAVSSGYWLDAIEQTQSYASKAYADAVTDDE